MTFKAISDERVLAAAVQYSDTCRQKKNKLIEIMKEYIIHKRVDKKKRRKKDETTFKNKSSWTLGGGSCCFLTIILQMSKLTCSPFFSGVTHNSQLDTIAQREKGVCLCDQPTVTSH